MNFTREPIIETIITPKEGNKLLVRSSKTDGQEEYTVDAVEVVAFGPALFFRSTEKPKSFLVPISDYEVVEVKETRVVLKNAQFERNIKIGGGRDASIRREVVEKEEEADEEVALTAEDKQEESEDMPQFDRKKDRRRGGRMRRRPEDNDMRARILETASGANNTSAPIEPKSAPSEMAPMAFTTLIPPPTTLISDSISKYKEMMKAPAVEGPAPVVEPVTDSQEPEESSDTGEENAMNRVVSSYEAGSFTGTQANFTSLSDWTNFLS